MPSITSLSTAIALSGTEPLPVDQSGATVKATVNQVKTYVNTTPAITGGSINSTPIGATTPSTGAFTTLSASGVLNTIGGTSQQTTLKVLSGGGNSAPVVSLFRSGNSEDFIASYPNKLIFGVTSGLVDYSDATLLGAAQMSLSTTALAVTGNISSSARTLVGTTTDDGVNALQVNGTAKTTSIKFANTGGTKQALDYYEEGTWIPNGVGLVITGSPGYSGTYTRIGRTVYITGAVTGAATIGLVAGTTISTNLPFTATTGIHVLGAVNGTALTSTTLAAQTVSLYATTAFTSGTAFYFSGTYAI